MCAISDKPNNVYSKKKKRTVKHFLTMQIVNTVNIIAPNSSENNDILMCVVAWGKIIKVFLIEHKVDQ